MSTIMENYSYKLVKRNINQMLTVVESNSENSSYISSKKTLFPGEVMHKKIKKTIKRVN